MEIFGHYLPILSGVQVCGKGVLVKPDFFGKLGEVPSCPRCLAVKQAVVVFPKLSWDSCALGGLGGLWRMWVIRTGIISITTLTLSGYFARIFLLSVTLSLHLATEGHHQRLAKFCLFLRIARRFKGHVAPRLTWAQLFDGGGKVREPGDGLRLRRIRHKLRDSDALSGRYGLE